MEEGDIVGQGFWKTIQKIADKYGEQFNGANSISGSMVEAAARHFWNRYT